MCLILHWFYFHSVQSASPKTTVLNVQTQSLGWFHRCPTHSLLSHSFAKIASALLLQFLSKDKTKASFKEQKLNGCFSPINIFLQSSVNSLSGFTGLIINAQYLPINTTHSTYLASLTPSPFTLREQQHLRVLSYACLHTGTQHICTFGQNTLGYTHLIYTKRFKGESAFD